MVDEQRLVFPVGQFGGMVRGGAAGEVLFAVRRGREVRTIASEPGMLWLDAHGRPDEPATTALAARTGYETLKGADLIVEVEVGGPQAVEFARAHRLIPRAHGLGNRSATPDKFVAGYPPNELGTFSFYQWQIWHSGHHDASLWDGCRRLVADERRAGYDVDVHELLTVTLRSVHVMLLQQLAYLDIARPSGEPAHE
jgi:hypothetical protein